MTIEKENHMPRKHNNRRSRLTAVALLVLLAALGLAACGGSSKSSSGATNASASATNGKGKGQIGARASALRECLKKAGITLPERKAGQSGAPGAGAPGAGGPGGPNSGQPPSGAPYGQPPSGGQSGRVPFGSGGGAGGPHLPKGVTRAQFEAAIKKCGGGAFRADGGGFDTAQGRQRYAKFAECMRQKGVKLPSPNTSGKGPIFNTKGIDTGSATFKSASAKCMKELRPSGAAAGPGGEGGAPPEGAAPPGGSGAAPGGAAPEGAAPEGAPGA
jgi:hypothetical protein